MMREYCDIWYVDINSGKPIMTLYRREIKNKEATQMLSLAIKFSVTSTVLWYACKIAVGYASVQTAKYDVLLSLVN